MNDDGVAGDLEKVPPRILKVYKQVWNVASRISLPLSHSEQSL